MRSSLLIAIIICVIMGALGGVTVATAIQTSLATSVLLGAMYGLFFALLSSRRATSPGAGLLWGLGFALILWLAIPAGIVPLLMDGMPAMGMLDTARVHFPELIAYLLCYGTPLGLALGILRLWIAAWQLNNQNTSNPHLDTAITSIPKSDNSQSEIKESAIRHPPSAIENSVFSWPRAIIVGGLAGIVGGWACGKWMAQVNFYPLIAGLVNSESMVVGITLHFVFAVIIGASFGVLFQR